MFFSFHYSWKYKYIQTHKHISFKYLKEHIKEKSEKLLCQAKNNKYQLNASTYEKRKLEHPHIWEAKKKEKVKLKRNFLKKKPQKNPNKHEVMKKLMR